MDDYANMKWEEHRASYTDDGTVHLNSLREEDLKHIDDAIVGYKDQRQNGTWSEFFWTGRNADRVILDYTGLDPAPWVLFGEIGMGCWQNQVIRLLLQFTLQIGCLRMDSSGTTM